jgi:hypothetical protein
MKLNKKIINKIIKEIKEDNKQKYESFLSELKNVGFDVKNTYYAKLASSKNVIFFDFDSSLFMEWNGKEYENLSPKKITYKELKLGMMGMKLRSWENIYFTELERGTNLIFNLNSYDEVVEDVGGSGDRLKFLDLLKVTSNYGFEDFGTGEHFKG